MGNPRKPAALKAIQGTARKDREYVPAIDLPELDEVPGPPSWLPNAHAVQEWDRLAPMLHRLGLLTQGGVTPLGHLCALHGTMVQKWAAGMEPQASTMQQYRSLCGEFGLTPVASTKVKTGRDEKPANKFARNGKQ
jgi:phage terminase small subunit